MERQFHRNESSWNIPMKLSFHENEYSTEQKFLERSLPRYESSTGAKVPGANVPRNKSSTGAKVLSVAFSLPGTKVQLLTWFFNVKWNFLMGLSRLQNKCGSFSAITWDIWTTLDTQFQKQITTRAEGTKITYAFYTIQHEGGRNIDFRQMSISGADYG